MKQHEWRPGRVRSIRRATARMIDLAIQPDEWIPHRGGQHYEIRFPGELLSRKFSIASGPARTESLRFGVQVLEKGMLSPRLAACRPGDRLEVRGPTGVAFPLHPDQEGPVVLIGGGSGITPLIALYDEQRATTSRPPLFLESAVSPDHIFCYEEYRDALITRFTGTAGRMDKSYLEDTLSEVLDDPGIAVRICGPSAFMGAMVAALMELGVAPHAIRSEAFV